jgi:thioredoxin 1
MKNRVIIAIVMVFMSAGSAFSQSQGISFIESTTWQKALKKAKAENKLIFMDAYTTWCGPCKMLEKRVFTMKEMGDFYNKNFVNVRVDMESGEGPALANIYTVNAYPTMFFIDPNTGKEITRVVGYHEAEDLLRTAEKVIKKKKS